MRYFTLVAAKASLPFGYLPFVGEMTGGATCGRMSGFEVELFLTGVTGGTVQNRFEILLLQMTLDARKSHGEISRTHMTCGALIHQAPSPPVTLVATELCMLSLQFPRMLELLRHFHLGGGGNLCLLTYD
jgi:hypothetical protein